MKNLYAFAFALAVALAPSSDLNAQKDAAIEFHRSSSLKKWSLLSDMTISLGYQSGNTSLSSISLPLFSPAGANISLGFRTILKSDKHFAEFTGDIDFATMGGSLGSTAGAGEQDFSAVQLFSGGSKAYGWRLGGDWGIGFSERSSRGWMWMSFDSLRSFLPTDQQSILSSYGVGPRVTSSNNIAITVRPSSWLAVDMGFNRQAIYRRHLLLMDGVSEVVTGVGSVLLGFPTSWLYDISPDVGMIGEFILNSAYTYGVYELRKNNMNWPFSTEGAMVIDSWRIDMRFTL